MWIWTAEKESHQYFIMNPLYFIWAFFIILKKDRYTQNVSKILNISLFISFEIVFILFILLYSFTFIFFTKIHYKNYKLHIFLQCEFKDFRISKNKRDCVFLIKYVLFKTFIFLVLLSYSSRSLFAKSTIFDSD